jgi:hypothetical protein
MTSWFLAKVAGGPAPSPASATVFIVAGLAAAKTSAGAPEVICVASPELPPNENLTETDGLYCSNSVPIRVNDSVSEAAASTVTGPSRPGSSLAPVTFGAFGSSSPEVSAQPPISKAAASATAVRSRALICRPLAPRPPWST